MREGRVTGSRLATFMRQGELKTMESPHDITVSRSGGGL